MRTLFTFESVAVFSNVVKATRPRRRGQMTLACLSAMMIALTGCDAHKPTKGIIGYVSGFAGAVSAEEPRAALVGEDILTAGGTAADAAVAMAATLTVTLPSRAGWSGGGVCLSRLPEDRSVHAFTFMPTALPGGGYAPGLPRGLYALHAASGVMRWDTVLLPAENLARQGTPVSRAFAKDLAQIGASVALDAQTLKRYSNADGSVLREGDRILQMRSAATMSSIRTRSAGEAYAGQLASLIAAANPQYDQERRNALRQYRAQMVSPVRVEFGNNVAFFPPVPFAGNASQTWEAAVKAETAQGVRVGGAVPAPYGSTGFVVADRGGMTVSCVLTMGKLFGSGQSIGATSLLAYSPVNADQDLKSMLPMIIANRHLKDLRSAVASSGSTAIPDALDYMARVQIGEENATAAVQSVAHAGDQMGRITGLTCPDGAPSKVDTCTVAVDPRGAGVSRMVGVDFDAGKKGVIF